MNCFKVDFDKNTTYLKAFAMKLSKDTHLAEDLFQETAFLAFKHQDKFQMGTNQKAWLSTVMKNLYINQYRKRKRGRALFDYTNEQQLLNSGNNSELNAAESSIMLEEIGSLVHQLSGNLKVPFQLAVEGFKYEEIAESMNLPLGTIKSRIFMARKVLQKQLAQLYPDSSSFEKAA